jgi:tRNA threonylcarbamoyladenosine biosynthesis protein TsaB
MKIAALEWSTASRSVALLDDEQCDASADVDEQAVVDEDAWSVLIRLMRDHGWNMAEVDVMAVGRGPGRYTGMRMALAAAQGWAAAGPHCIFTVSSGEALAWEARETFPEASHIAVLGDARRERVWAGLFTRHGEGLQHVDDWTLYTWAELLEKLPPQTYLFTADQHRWPDVIEQVAKAGLVWRDQPCFPKAKWVARLAYRRIVAGLASDPVSPIYMHPAVATPSPA